MAPQTQYPEVLFFDPVEGDLRVRYKVKKVIVEAPIESPHPDVMLVERAFPWLGQLVDLCEELDLWEMAQVQNDGHDGPREDPYMRTSPATSILGSVHERLEPFQMVLQDIEVGFIKAYQAFFNRHAVVKTGSGFELLRYGPGQFFKEHVDDIHESKNGARRLSLCAFWSSDDCEGGELVLPRQGLEFAPCQGDVLVFPSCISFPHEAKPVTKGTKYSLVTWYL